MINIKLTPFICKSSDYNFPNVAFCNQPSGANEQDDQTAYFGKKYAKNIPDYVTSYAGVYIFQDDTIDVVKRKVLFAWGVLPKNKKIIKLTCQSRVNNINDMTNDFVTKVCQGRRMIPIEDLNEHIHLNILNSTVPVLEENSVSFKTATQIVKTILQSENAKMIISMDNDSATIESFSPENNEFSAHIVTGEQSLDGFKEDSKYKQILSTYKEVHKSKNRMEDARLTTHVHVRVHPQDDVKGGVKDDVYSVFTMFKASKKIPYAKWLSPSNAMIKVSKRFVSTPLGKKRAIVWSRVDHKRRYNSINEVLVFKVIPYTDEPISASIILYSVHSNIY